jgi:hypothetical protein
MRCPVRRLLRRRFASQRHGLVRCHVRVIRLRWPHVDRFRRRMSCGETSEIFDLPLRSAGMVVGAYSGDRDRSFRLNVTVAHEMVLRD